MAIPKFCTFDEKEKTIGFRDYVVADSLLWYKCKDLCKFLDGKPGYFKLNLNKVDSLPREAFKNCKVTNVVGPKINKIGRECFYGCIGLKEINFPNLESADDGCFSDCTRLKEINFPNLKSAKDGCFSRTGLEDVVLLELNSAGIGCFSDCTGLKEINFPNLKSANDGCFSRTGLEDVVLPGLNYAGIGCFSDCTGLKEIWLPNLKVIKKGCFKGCLNLHTVRAPKVEKVEEGAFEGCNSSILSFGFSKDVEINDEVIKNLIKSNPSAGMLKDEFADTKTLFDQGGEKKGIRIEEHITGRLSLDLCKKICLFLKDNPSYETLDLANVEELPEGAFEYCKNLKKIIGTKVTQIAKGGFRECSKLEKVILPKLINAGDECFFECTELTEIELPVLRTLGVKCFSKTGLKNVKLDNLHEIGEYCFRSAKNLETVSLRDLESVPLGCFSYCSKLRSVYLPKVKRISKSAFEGCNNLDPRNKWELKKITTAQHSTSKSDEDDPFGDIDDLIIKGTGSSKTVKVNSMFSSLSKAQCIRINNFFSTQTRFEELDLWNVKKLPDSAFGDSAIPCRNLKKIIGSKVLRIGERAFSGCDELVEVDLPMLIIAGDECFCKCKKLTSVKLPKLEYAGVGCFSDCVELKKITLPELTKAGMSCFEGASQLDMAGLPKLQSVPSLCFCNCVNLTSVNIMSATKIKSGAFKGCKKLNIVAALKNNLRVVEKDAFDESFLDKNKEKRPARFLTPDFVAGKSEDEVKVEHLEELPDPEHLCCRTTDEIPQLYPSGRPQSKEINTIKVDSGWWRKPTIHGWFLSALKHLAKTNPQAIIDCIEDDPENGKTTISFYKVTKSSVSCVPGSRVKITVRRNIREDDKRQAMRRTGVRAEEFDRSALWVKLMLIALGVYMERGYLKRSAAHAHKPIMSDSVGYKSDFKPAAITMITGKAARKNF